VWPNIFFFALRRNSAVDIYPTVDDTPFITWCHDSRQAESRSRVLT